MDKLRKICNLSIGIDIEGGKVAFLIPSLAFNKFALKPSLSSAHITGHAKMKGQQQAKKSQSRVDQDTN